MDGWIVRHVFWPLALLWLPAGVIMQAVLRFASFSDAFADPGVLLTALGSLAITVPCGLPLALGCLCLRRLGYRHGAWAAGIALGLPTVWITVIAGLLGPIAIAVCTAVLSLPVWIAWGWLARAGRKRSG